MGIIKERWLSVVAVIMVLIVATACFQQVGDQAQGQAVSVVSTDTDTPPPPPSLTPETTEEPSRTPTAADIVIANNPTDTPTATITAAAVAQSGDDLTPTQPDDFNLRATQLVLDTTMTVVIPLTWTAEALIGSTDTPTPTDSIIPGTTNLPGGDCIHEVRAGETMYSYSLYYGVPVADIATRNGIVNPNIISIGAKLIIPGCGTTGALPPPTSVPSPTITPFQFATTFGTGGTDLGGDANPGLGGTTTGCAAQYTVQQYDTLFQISLQYGVAVQSIANANAILNINRIDMGTVLCIPAQ